jgi:hypothetical protein
MIETEGVPSAVTTRLAIDQLRPLERDGRRRAVDPNCSPTRSRIGPDPAEHAEIADSRPSRSCSAGR